MSASDIRGIIVVLLLCLLICVCFAYAAEGRGGGRGNGRCQVPDDSEIKNSGVNSRGNRYKSYMDGGYKYENKDGSVYFKPAYGPGRFC
jgi:hypothetical protein